MHNRLASALLILSFAIPARADWPRRVFAPYMYIGAGDNFELTDCEQTAGLKYYTLAFIIARQEGRGDDVRYLLLPAWDGRMAMEQNVYLDQIRAIRNRGGDVIMSFGGEAGREIAIIIEDPAALVAAYQSIIDRYKFTWLDFDIEGDNLNRFPEASRRRNTALAALQAKNVGLRISYTLPVDPDGISHSSQALLADAGAKGLKVYSANLMIMYFGKRFINKGRTEGELGIDSAKTAYAQLQKIDPAIQVGLCPCLGRNGSPHEVFGLADAATLEAFADQTPWVCSLHYWSINDDAARQRGNGASAQSTTRFADTANTPWAFARIFMPFTTSR